MDRNIHRTTHRSIHRSTYKSIHKSTHRSLHTSIHNTATKRWRGWRQQMDTYYPVASYITLYCPKSSSIIAYYWRGTAKRLIRINLIDIGGVQTIHCFGHQSGRGERSGGLSTAIFLCFFGARLFGHFPRSTHTQYY